MAGGKKKLQLEGQTFNRLTVIKFAYIKKHHTYWECICSCANKTIIVVGGSQLLNGNTKSCGCLKLEGLIARTLPPEHHKEMRHKDYVKHREERLEARKKYREDHHDEILEKMKLDRQMNPEKYDVIDKQHYEKAKEKVKVRNLKPERRFYNAKFRTIRSKVPWILTFEEYINIISDPCHYCGASLSSETGSGLDRINNNKSIGYRLGNVLPCCGDCNRTRGDRYTVEETEIMIKAVLEFRQKNDK